MRFNLKCINIICSNYICTQQMMTKAKNKKNNIKLLLVTTATISTYSTSNDYKLSLPEQEPQMETTYIWIKANTEMCSEHQMSQLGGITNKGRSRWQWCLCN